MRLFAVLLYIATATGAIADPYGLEALRSGDMAKLSVHSEPKAVSDATFTHEDGSEAQLADYAGDVVVLNFWATWCAPCRKEMPALSTLQERFADEGLQVVTVASGRNPPPKIEEFLQDIGAENLPRHTDPRMGLSRSMAVLGLPVTVILDREGHEVARLQGDADWASEEAFAVIEALLSE